MDEQEFRAQASAFFAEWMDDAINCEKGRAFTDPGPDFDDLLSELKDVLTGFTAERFSG